MYKLKQTNDTEDKLKPAEKRVYELKPAEERVYELKPAEVSVNELDELSELSDIDLELDELSDTEDGAGLAAGRNGPLSDQKEVIQPMKKSITNSLWICFKPNSTSLLISPFQAHSHHKISTN